MKTVKKQKVKTTNKVIKNNNKALQKCKLTKNFFFKLINRQTILELKIKTKNMLEFLQLFV